ncbi:TcaA second domain-containing protein [Staphylococcus epidermidis]|uniref:TcaA second domain-containing protein n=1 Tax=Staphylococcus epidermidis TaxID=1282 RepID=UPI000C18EB65|nr:hypothetical protein [Staphylococcus epidermidis]PIH51390.1 hypothetical protein CTI96_07820 [Staphylococcus epidermidis]
MDYTNQKRKYIIFGIVLAITLLIVGIAYYLISLNNAKGQVKEFEKLVQHNDYNSIAKKLSNKEETLSENDAKNFVLFVKSKENQEQYNEQIQKIKSNIDKNKDNNTVYGSITDQYGNNLITIKKNGKTFFFIDKLEFKPKLTSVYVKEFNNTGIYKYQQENAKKVIAESNQTTELGKFFIGKYSIKTDKTIEDSIHNGTLTGKIDIDLSNRGNNNKIYADEDFNQSWFKVKLNNDSLLEKNSYKLLIDDKDVDYNSKKTYGKYYNPTELSVYAIGKLEGKEFKTNRINIRRNYDNKPQNLKLSFKESQIRDYESKSKKVKEKAKSYIKEYTKELNKAYKKKDYKYISDYVKNNSQLEKQLKKQVKSKSKVKFKGSVAKLKLYAHLYKTIKANIVLTVKSFVSINYFSFFSINIT